MSHSPDATGVCAKQVAYLAGPMRGYAEYNFPAFHAAAAKLRGHGLDVWSPAEHDVNEDGFDPAKDTHQPMKHYMRRDLPAVLDADMVCVLPGWEKSQGACLEVLVAQTCGIPVYVAETMQPVPSKPSEMVTTPEGGRDHSYLTARLMKASFEVSDPDLGNQMRAAAGCIRHYDREFNEARLSAIEPRQKSAGTCMYCGHIFHAKDTSQPEVARVYHEAIAHDQVCPDNPLAKDAARWRALKELAGYYQDGSQQTIKLYQDDALRSCFIEAGRKTYGTDGSSFDSALDQAIKEAANG